MRRWRETARTTRAPCSTSARAGAKCYRGSSPGATRAWSRPRSGTSTRRWRPHGSGRSARASSAPDSLRLPFVASSFDLVLDRHEALEPREVARVLAPGGTVITQQCGPDDWPELGRFLPKTVFPDHFNGYQQGFAAAGLTVEDARWHEDRVAFETLGDLVYLLLVAPWSFPEFDPGRDIDALLALEDALGIDDGIVMTELRYLIVASKPG